ncbi:MAG: PSD1 domain-containing protein [Planctomycetales bacterium]|nr:PSD1 domain-containing protein [Planctomycetales bacterium]
MTIRDAIMTPAGGLGRIGPPFRWGIPPFLLLCLVPVVAEAQPAEPVRFAQDVRPILVAHCTACHGGVEQAAGLSFVYPEQVLPPDGWVVEPGAPESSAMLQRVVETDPDLRMPPPEHGRALTPGEIDVIRRWIAEGARWQSHWSLEPPVAPARPEVKHTDWPRTDLDYYILARQEQAGVAPAPDADPRRWLRRVSLDLTGLPPAPDEAHRFLAGIQDHGEAAYAKAVDRLLASPGFGERWASVWLDQVRYADSKGLGQDGRRTIWAYRDWVIRALNADMPYNQFTIKQLAGDLLPGDDPENVIATACQRLTASNEEGGTDDEQFRVEAVLDRVNTTWQAWLGSTFGCCQCHSHPYDPFRHEDYYRFAALFNSTLDSDLDNDYPTYRAPLNPEHFQRAAELDQRTDELRQAVWKREDELLTDSSAWRPLELLEAGASTATRVRIEQVGNHQEFQTIGAVSRNTDFVFLTRVPAELHTLTALRVSVLPVNPDKALADSEWGFVLSNVAAALLDHEGKKLCDVKFVRVLSDTPENAQDPQQTLNPKSAEGYGALSRINNPRECALVLDAPLELPEGAQLRVRIKHRVYVNAAFTLLARRGHLAVTDDARFTELPSDELHQTRIQQLEQLRKDRAKIPSSPVPVMAERPAHLPRESRVFLRGLFLDKGEVVTAGAPKSMRQLDEGQPADRLAMARWIASPDNPLTARVAVNRWWARLFGAGLVVTEEDFGSSGDPPSNQPLLDYLACKFSGEHQWSMKRTLREMVLSRTYRQSGKTRADLQSTDPDNRLLARGPRFRLTSEMVRDQALAVSGLLSDKRYGPPVHPPIPAGVWTPFQGADKWNVPQPGEPDRCRRSIYTYVKRSIPYPTQATFDAPSREFCTPRRLPSNTPLQALATLNGEQFVECSQALGKRMAENSPEPRQQIAHGFELATCRAATEEELDELLKLYASFDAQQRGLSAVAGVLLNLDEIMVK